MKGYWNKFERLTILKRKKRSVRIFWMVCSYFSRILHFCIPQGYGCVEIGIHIMRYAVTAWRGLFLAVKRRSIINIIPTIFDGWVKPIRCPANPSRIYDVIGRLQLLRIKFVG